MSPQGAFGTGMMELVRNIYSFLSLNWESGDEVSTLPRFPAICEFAKNPTTFRSSSSGSPVEHTQSDS